MNDTDDNVSNGLGPSSKTGNDDESHIFDETGREVSERVDHFVKYQGTLLVGARRTIHFAH